MIPIQNTVTAPLQHLELVVQPFDKTTVSPVLEVIGDLLPPSLQGFQKLVKALQAALLDPLDPVTDLPFSHCFWQVLVKDSRQLSARWRNQLSVIVLLQLWGSMVCTRELKGG
jgi:hypothetical protein